jgi:hypothetical protein
VKKSLKTIDWLMAGVAFGVLCWVGGAEYSMTMGDLAPMIPLYVIAWRAQDD